MRHIRYSFKFAVPLTTCCIVLDCITELWFLSSLAIDDIVFSLQFNRDCGQLAVVLNNTMFMCRF